jgi:predicted house-cleaning noncanonical NTP pyrophosphatase (MazG superfamily)
MDEFAILMLVVDNPNRATRCAGLANNIGEIITNTKRLVDEQLKVNKDLYNALNELLAVEGKTTVEDLYNEVLASLSEEERKKYIEIQTDLAKLNQDLALVDKVSIAIGGVSSIRNFVIVFFTCSGLTHRLSSDRVGRPTRSLQLCSHDCY